jgi:hypothetical protein
MTTINAIAAERVRRRPSHRWPFQAAFFAAGTRKTDAARIERMSTAPGDYVIEHHRFLLRSMRKFRPFCAAARRVEEGREIVDWLDRHGRVTKGCVYRFCSFAAAVEACQRHARQRAGSFEP